MSLNVLLCWKSLKYDPVDSIVIIIKSIIMICDKLLSPRFTAQTLLLSAGKNSEICTETIFERIKQQSSNHIFHEKKIHRTVVCLCSDAGCCRLVYLCQRHNYRREKYTSVSVKPTQSIMSTRPIKICVN